MTAPDVDPWELAWQIDRNAAAADVEAAIRYLEADPWDFRTGYGKTMLLRRVKRAELSQTQRARVRNVLLHYVDVGPRWDLREACALAPAVADRQLRDDLVERLHADDRPRALRALRMLLRIRRPRLGRTDVERARAVVLHTYGERRWPPLYLRHVVRRLWSPAWGQELVAAADDEHDPFSAGARSLLHEVPRLAARARGTSP